MVFLSEVDIQNKLSKINVLVAEDNEFDRELLVTTLKSIGLRNIQVAENGRIAAAKIETAAAINKPFEVVFSDWKMPSLDGRALIKIIKSNHRLHSTIVIMTTGSSSQKDVEVFRAAGVNAYVVKPVALEVIREKLFKTLKIELKNAS